MASVLVRIQKSIEPLAVDPLVITRHITKLKRAAASRFEKISDEYVVESVSAILVRAATVAKILDLLPDICPLYLESRVEEFQKRPDDLASVLISEGYVRKNETIPSATSRDFEVHPYTAVDPEIREWHCIYLQNRFQQIQKPQLYAAYAASNHSLTAAVHAVLHAKVDTQTTLKGKRPLQSLPVDHEKYSICHAEASFLHSRHERFMVRAARIATDLANNNTTTCNVCFDTKTMTECVGCTNSHTVCEDCYVTYVKTKLFDYNCATRSCVDVSCDGVYTESRLRLLDSKTRQAFTRCETRKALRDSGILESLHACRACGNETEVDEGVTTIRCVCGCDTCVLCGDAAHAPLRCDEVVGNAETQARKRVEEAMTAALLRTCVCGTSFLKSSGCNKMTCPTCGKYLCYVCKSTISGYDHFRDSPTCALYMDTERSDATRVATTGETVLQSLTQ